MSQFRIFLPSRLLTVAMLAAWFVCGANARLEAIEADTVYPTDPTYLTPPSEPQYSPRLKVLWLEALARPEIDLKRRAAATIGNAHKSKVPDLQSTAPQLIAELDAPQAHPAVKLAAAQSLIKLDARQSAAVLMKHALADSWDLAELIEPALARWKHVPMQAVWLKRLNDPVTRPRSLLLTIRCIDLAEHQEAAPALREIALNRQQGPDVRLAAARVLGRLKTEKSEDDAKQLTTGDAAAQRLINHLVAASLLMRHQGSAAERLLLQLAAEPAPAVSAIALQRLLELNPQLVEPLNGQILASTDANVRLLAAKIYQGQKSVAAVGHLGTLLDDPDPQTRKTAQAALIELSKIDALNVAVKETVTKVLALEAPRGLEQAALVIGGIDHEPAADRLVQLLEHKEPHVAITAAWALRRLLVPATAKPIFEKVKTDTEKSMISLPLTAVVDMDAVSAMYRQQEHLLEALGLLRYREAESLLIQYFPTPPERLFPPDIRLDTLWVHDLRLRAIWALGKIYENDPKPNVVASLLKRFQDPDSEDVRATCAISLGRMQAKTVVDELRESFKPGEEYSKLAYGCALAVSTLTGEPIPEFTLTPIKTGRGGWFLEPLD